LGKDINSKRKETTPKYYNDVMFGVRGMFLEYYETVNDVSTLKSVYVYKGIQQTMRATAEVFGSRLYETEHRGREVPGSNISPDGCPG
jgi:hypothetical protein